MCATCLMNDVKARMLREKTDAMGIASGAPPRGHGPALV